MSFYPRCRPTPCWRTRLSTPTSAFIEPVYAGKFVIPPKSNRKVQRLYDKELYKARHLMENFYCKLKQYRAIATRYDKTAKETSSAPSIWPPQRLN